MKLNIFKKKQSTTPETIPVCSTNQDKPECSLIQELREIQEEKLNLEDNFYFRKKEILTKLYGNNNTYRYQGIVSCKEIGMLDKIEIAPSANEIDKVITLFQEYKDILEKESICNQRKKELQQREKEIKEQLGIK